MKLVIALAAALAVATPVAAQMLIVRASGPSAAQYLPGRMLDAKRAVVLQAGDEVVVMNGAGTRTLRGPGTFAAGASSGAAGVGTLVAALGDRTSARREVTGAIRGGPPAHPDGLWMIDSDAGGTVCLVNVADAVVWRGATADATSLSIKRGSDGAASSVDFAAGSSTAPWPSEIAPARDEQYLVGPDQNPRVVDVKIVAPTGDDWASLARAMAAKGCTRQLAMLQESAGTVAATGGQ